MVKSVMSSKPIEAIAALHCGGKIDLDLTYGRGGIYSGTSVVPSMSIDQRPGAMIQADLREGIPFEDRSLSSLVYDPPFIVRKNWDKKDHFLFHRFAGFHTTQEAVELHEKVINEAKRVLKRYGILVVKIQDCSLKDGGTFWATQKVFEIATRSGFKCVDQFIEVSPVPKPLPASVKKQKMARKVHCTWWVFKKV